MATFRKLKSGNWQARVMVDGKYKPVGTFKTKKQAQVEANKIEEKMYYGQALDDREMLFSDLVEKWLAHKKIDNKPTTYRKNEMIARVHLLPYFAGKKIIKIKRPHIIEWINEYAKTDLKHATRKKYYAVLKSIFNYAVNELQVLTTNPCLNLNIPNKDKENKIKHYTMDELNQLLDYLKNRNIQKHKEYNLYYVLFFFLSRTGLRISEAVGLTWNDLNEDMLTVNKQVYRDENNADAVESLKNESSDRIIKLDNETLTLLKQFKLTQSKCALKYKTFIKSDVMFQKASGDYLSYSEIRANLNIYCINANVDYKGTHTFRHTHATLSLEAGATLEYISKRLGHKSISTTADIYSDITTKIEDNELKKIESYMAQKWHSEESEEI